MSGMAGLKNPFEDSPDSLVGSQVAQAVSEDHLAL